MGADDELTTFTLPLAGRMHAHTGCFFIECTLCDETELWVFGAGPPPRFDEQRRPRFRPGQTLGGFVRPVGDATETMQRDLEASA